MTEGTETATSTAALAMAADLVSAYVSNNSVPVNDLPGLIQSIHGTLINMDKPAPGQALEAVALVPAISIKKSVTPEFIICLEDGRKFKSLKRHLSAAYGLSPSEYRKKWGLPTDYPMVAPSYAESRSNLAKSMGLGQARGKPAPEPTKVAKAAAVKSAPAKATKTKAAPAKKKKASAKAH